MTHTYTLSKPTLMSLFCTPKGYIYWYGQSATILRSNLSPVVGASRNPANTAKTYQTDQAGEFRRLVGEGRVKTLKGNVIFVREHLCHYWHFHIEVLGQLLLLRNAGAFNASNHEVTYCLLMLFSYFFNVL
jgi:hypothetical protein